MPTPARVRGKAGNKRQFQSPNESVAGPTIGPMKLKQNSYIERLPNELLQEIAWLALSPELALSSPILYPKLDNRMLQKKFIYLAFFDCEWITRPHPHTEGESLKIMLPDPGSIGPVAVDRKLQHRLQQSIFKQRWFNPHTFFTCKREYLENVTPLGIRRYFSPDFNTTWRQWSIMQTIINDHAPVWFRMLVGAIAPTKEVFPHLIEKEPANNTREDSKDSIFPELTIPVLYSGAYGPSPSVENSALEGLDHIWQSRWRFTIWRASHVFSYGLSPIDVYEGEEFPTNLLNVETWSMQKLALLLQVRGSRNSFEVFTAKGAEALSTSLMKAIEQQFVPAVIMLSQSPWSVHQQPYCQGVAAEIMDEILEDTLLASKSSPDWLDLWYDRLHVMMTSVDETTTHNPTEVKHLKRALELAMQETADECTFEIFCWLSLAYLKTQIADQAEYPERLIQELHSMVLTQPAQERHTADEGYEEEAGDGDEDEEDSTYAERCYQFFTDATARLWRAKSLSTA